MQRQLLELSGEALEFGPLPLGVLLGELALGDVACEAEDPDHPAGACAQRHLGRRDPAHAPVGPELALLESDDRLARAHDLELGRARRPRVGGGKEVVIGLAEGVLHIVEVEPARQRRADQREPALHVLEVHVVGRVLEERLEQVAGIHLRFRRRAGSVDGLAIWPTLTHAP